MYFLYRWIDSTNNCWVIITKAEQIQNKKLRVIKCSKQSLLLNLFFQFILINNFLEISKSLSSVVKYFRLFDTLTYDFVEDNLKSYWYSALFKVIVVLFANFLYFRVLLAFFLWTLFTHLRFILFLIYEVNIITLINFGIIKTYK